MLRRLIVLGAAAGSLCGCYVYTAAPPAPAPGSQLLVEINDRGRVGLGDSIGSSAQVIEGKSVSTADSAITLSVSRISYLTGQSNGWTGEQLVIPKMFVTNVRERKFSKSRSWLVSDAVAAAVGAFIASRDIIGFGSTNGDDNGGGNNGSTK